jgi:hypothetical protein
MQVAANNINSPLFPSQTSLGLWGNPEGKEYSRETMNRSAKYLASRGLITKRYRYKQTCVYTLHPLFMSPEARPLLLPLIPAARKLPTFQFCATLLFSLLAPNVTQLEVSNYPLRGRIITSSSLRNTRSQSENLTTKKIVSDQQFESGIKILKAMGLTPPENIYELKKRQEEQMHQQQGKQIEAPTISKAIRAIKSLQLSKWGQMKLSVFTDEALSFADGVTLRAPAHVDRFEYFFGIAHQVSKERKLAVDMALFMELARKYSMPANAKMTLDVEFAPNRDGEIIFQEKPEVKMPLEPKTAALTKKPWQKEIKIAKNPITEAQSFDAILKSADGRPFGIDMAPYFAACCEHNASDWEEQHND